MHVTRKTFDALFEQALADLPPQFAQWIHEVPIILEDAPSPQLLRDLAQDAPSEDPDDPDSLLGLYTGTALTHRSLDDSARLPDHILIFRRPLMALCSTKSQLLAEIRKTLLHELGHYAGLSEDDLTHLGYD